jgi:hypothetical protein
VTSRIEQRLRDELHAIARQVAPADLRPLRQPTAASRMRERFLAPAAAVTGIVVIAGGFLVARDEWHARAAFESPYVPAATVADPAVIAVAGTGTAGGEVRLTSASTGRVTATLPVPAGGNGIALAPDAKTLFVPQSNLRLTQVSVTTGKSKIIGTGAYPAVSPDSEFVAYATGSSLSEVAIRNVSTGRTRTLSLTPLVGSGSTLVNRGGLTWLGDGSEVVAVAEPDATTTSVTSAPLLLADRLAKNPCGQQDARAGLCAIVIKVARRLSARRVYLHGVAGAAISVLSGDLTAERTFFVGTAGLSPMRIRRISLVGRGARVHLAATLPSRSTDAVALAPDGDRLVYGSPSGARPRLWIASISHGRLTDRRRLLIDSPSFELSQAAW